MTSIPQPVVKSILVCEDVLRDDRGNIHLMGVFHRIRRGFPLGSGARYAYPQLCLVAGLTDAQGEYDVDMAVFLAGTDSPVFTSSTRSILLPDRLELNWIVFRMQDCSFPTAGVYFVEFSCNGDVLADVRIPVID